MRLLENIGWIDGTLVTPTRINATADGDNTILTAGSTGTYCIVGLFLVVDVAGTITLIDDDGPTTLVTLPLLASTPFVLPMASMFGPWFTGGLGGSSFIINNPAGVDTVGRVYWWEK